MLSSYPAFNATDAAQGEWLASGLETKSTFSGIDLQDDYYDYDDKSGEVSIKDIVWEIRRS